MRARTALRSRAKVKAGSRSISIDMKQAVNLSPRPTLAGRRAGLGDHAGSGVARTAAIGAAEGGGGIRGARRPADASRSPGAQ